MFIKCNWWSVPLEVSMKVMVSEVGPRDGLQSIKRAMPTAVKHQWIRALAAAGLKEIEVASFVPPKRLPQMADAPEVVREALKIPGITVLALVPNLRGGCPYAPGATSNIVIEDLVFLLEAMGLDTGIDTASSRDLSPGRG